MQTLLIEIESDNAYKLLHELEALNILKIVNEKKTATEPQKRLSEKYKGIFSKEDAKSFDTHTLTMREEW